MYVRRVKCITSLKEPYYTYVRGGEKAWEIRLKKDDWADVQEGDWILAFRKDGKGEFVIFEVVERREFPSFRAALEDVGFENAVPCAENLEEALEEYAKIYGGQKKRVLALRIRRVAEFSGEISPEKLEKYLANFRGDVA